MVGWRNRFLTNGPPSQRFIKRATWRFQGQTLAAWVALTLLAPVVTPEIHDRHAMNRS